MNRFNDKYYVIKNLNGMYITKMVNVDYEFWKDASSWTRDFNEAFIFSNVELNEIFEEIDGHSVDTAMRQGDIFPCEVDQGDGAEWYECDEDY